MIDPHKMNPADWPVHEAHLAGWSVTRVLDRPSWRVGLLAMAGVSSAVAGLAGTTWSWTTSWLPGLVFGLLVMLPWGVLSGLSRSRTAVGLASAVGGHAAAAGIMLHGPAGSAWVAGLAGSAILTLPFWFSGRPEVSRAVWLAILAGLVGGPLAVGLADLGLFDSDLPAPMAWGLMAWQGPVTLMLTLGWRRRVDLRLCLNCSATLEPFRPLSCPYCGQRTDHEQQHLLAQLHEHQRWMEAELAREMVEEAGVSDQASLTGSGGDRFGDIPLRL